MNKLKYLFIGALGILVVVLLVAYSLSLNPERAGAVTEARSVQVVNEFNATSTYYADEDSLPWLTATSTWWLTPNAANYEGTVPGAYVATATSKTLTVSGADQVGVDMFIFATGTAPVISVDVKASADGNEWYDFIPPFINTNNLSFSDAYTLATSTSFAYLAQADDAGTATTTVHFTLDLSKTAAKFLRLYFGASASTTLRTEYMIK